MSLILDIQKLYGTDSIGNFEYDTAEREVLQSADLTHAGVLG